MSRAIGNAIPSASTGAVRRNLKTFCLTVFRRRSLRQNLVFRVPIRVWRKLVAGETLRFHPLEQACRTNAASVKRVPNVSAGASPAVFFPRRPAAFRATNVWAGRPGASLNFAFRHKSGSICLKTHGCAVPDYNNCFVIGLAFAEYFLIFTAKPCSQAGNAADAIDCSRKTSLSLQPSRAYQYVYRLPGHP